MIAGRNSVGYEIQEKFTNGSWIAVPCRDDFVAVS